MESKDKIINHVNKPGGAIILAGGDSKRIGRPKAFLDFNGKPLVKLMVDRLSLLFNDLTIVTNSPELYSNLPVTLTGDILKHQGKSPLRGIHAGLSNNKHHYQFVVACDMPFLNLELVKYMASFASDYDAVVPHLGKEYYQPLHAYYKRSCIGVIEQQLNRGCFKVNHLYRNLKVRFITAAEIARYDPDHNSFFNINTWNDYKQALELMTATRESNC